MVCQKEECLSSVSALDGSDDACSLEGTGSVGRDFETDSFGHCEWLMSRVMECFRDLGME